MELKGGIQPLMVLIKEAEKETKTDSGIIIPKTAAGGSMKGTVVLVGPGTDDFPSVLAEGMNVLYHPHAGSKVEIEGSEYRLMRQNEVFYYY